MHVLFVLTLFFCVVLHELGHSLLAIKLGGKVHSITLLPIGGMANISRMPEKPKDEFLVSAAGPMVNIIIAALLWLYLTFFSRVNWGSMEYEFITTQNFAVMLMAANLFIVAFNLIPAFPMDGGRIFRSALAVKMKRVDATRVAKNVGQIFALLFIVAGVFINPFLVIIGLFIFLGAKGEYEMVRYQDILVTSKVGDLVLTNLETLAEDDLLEYAVKKLVQMPGRGFVVKSGDEYKGVLTKNDLLAGLGNFGKQGRVGDVMSEHIQTLDAEMTLFDAFKRMKKNDLDLAPVMDNNTFVGMLDVEKINDFYAVQKALQ